MIHIILHRNHLSVSVKKRRKTDISIQMQTQVQMRREELAGYKVSFWSGADGRGQGSTHPGRPPAASTLLICSTTPQEKPAPSADHITLLVSLVTTGHSLGGGRKCQVPMEGGTWAWVHLISSAAFGSSFALRMRESQPVRSLDVRQRGLMTST